jgi:hypothetical protein
LQVAKDWKTIEILIAESGEFVLQSRSGFLLGCLLLQTGHFYIATNRPLDAIRALWVADQIHTELQSRPQAETKQLLAKCLEDYGDLPQVQAWMNTVRGKTWEEITTNNRLLSAHDLHTIHE